MNDFTTTAAAEQIDAKADTSAEPKASLAAEAAFERVTALMHEIKEIIDDIPHIKDDEGKEDMEVFFIGHVGVVRGDSIAACDCQVLRGDRKIGVVIRLLRELPRKVRAMVFMATESADSKED